MTLRENLTGTFDKLLSVIQKFTPGNLNKIPFKDSWTPGQVVEHLVKGNGGIPQILHGKAEPTTTREPAEKVAMLNQIFLDFSTKMKSPENIVPTKTDHTKEKLIEKQENIRKEILEVIENDDLTMTCKDFEFPGMGHFTRIEWINFCIVHTQRHTHQLEEIYSHFQKTNE